MNKFWTPIEIEQLAKFYPVEGIKYCSNLLNRTESSIAKKALRLKLSAPGGRLKTHVQYEQELFDKELDFVPLEPYAGANVPILHECIEGHKIKISPSNIFQGSGCKICSNRFTRSHQEYAKEIPWEVLDPYIDTRTPITHRCTEGHEWKASPSNIMRGRGCPQCATSGFNPNNPAILYYLKVYKNNSVFYKVGITNRTVKERFNKIDYDSMTILYEVPFDLGSDAKELEQSILTEFKEYRLKNIEVLTSGGNTELFDFDILGFDI